MRGRDMGIDVVLVGLDRRVVPLRSALGIPVAQTDGREQHAGVRELRFEILGVYRRGASGLDLAAIEIGPAAVEVGGIPASLSETVVLGTLELSVGHGRDIAQGRLGQVEANRPRGAECTTVPTRIGSRSRAAYTSSVFHRRMCRVGLALFSASVLCLVSLAEGCKASPAGDADPPLAAAVDPDFEEDWNALLQAREQGKNAEAAADRLLEREPPLRLQIAALRVKAEEAHAAGRDQDTIRYLDDALSRAEREPGAIPPEVWVHLGRLRAFALTRGGEPARALLELNRLREQGQLESEEWWASRAIALDRSGATEAVVAFAAWRSELKESAPEIGYVEERLRSLLATTSIEQLSRLALTAPDAAAACLRARIEEPRAALPNWLAACQGGERSIGVLLPRSGRLSALADIQMGAISASVEVLSREQGRKVWWVDSGSTSDSVKVAAQKLEQKGVDVVVGPIGRSNVKSASTVLGGERLIIPGEAPGKIVGVAPSLEARIHALVEHAKSESAPGIVLWSPDNSYGRRCQKGLRVSAKKIRIKQLKILSYSGDQSGFSSTVKESEKALQSGAALLVCDALPRVEFALRQLQRSSVSASGGLVLSTMEQLEPSALFAPRAPFDGVVVAPVAAPGAGSSAFEVTYSDRQGRAPSDQALLIWAAMSRAWEGGAASERVESAMPSLHRIQGGQLVPLAKK